MDDLVELFDPEDEGATIFRNVANCKSRKCVILVVCVKLRNGM